MPPTSSLVCYRNHDKAYMPLLSCSDVVQVVDPLQQGGKKYNRVENRQKKMQTEWAAKSRS